MRASSRCIWQACARISQGSNAPRKEVVCGRQPVFTGTVFTEKKIFPATLPGLLRLSARHLPHCKKPSAAESVMFRPELLR